MQAAVGEGNRTLSLFEMATGTGKTLTAAAVIRLFLRSGNVPGASSSSWIAWSWRTKPRRPSSAVQLKNDFHLGDLQGDAGTTGASAEIVVTTVQSLALQQQVPKCLFLANRLRSGDFRRSAPLHRRQRPRRVRLFHRLQARPHRHAARLPPPKFDSSNLPTTRDPRESLSADCCSTPTAPSGARTGLADLPLFVAGWRERGFSDQPNRGCRCPHGDHHARCFPKKASLLPTFG